jgi:threonine dehydratase
MTNPELQAELLIKEREASNMMSRRSPILRTQAIENGAIDSIFGENTTVVSELHQPGRSFKVRGALFFAMNLTYAERKSGIVAASAGNHAGGIAIASRLLKIKSDIFMPGKTPKNKVDLVSELGGEYVQIHPVEGDEFDESLALAQAYAQKEGKVFSSPFDDINVIAGQSTLGVEIHQDINNIGALFVPVGGMGLIAGIASAIKSRDPSIKIIGVEPEHAASLQYARQQGRPTSLRGEFSTFIDGAAVRQVGELPFVLANDLVDDVISVSDGQVRTATTELWGIDKSWSWLVRAELAGALALTGLREYGYIDNDDRKSVAIITGGNLSPERFEREVRV